MNYELVENLKKLQERRDTFIQPQRLFLVFNKQEWLRFDLFKVTEEEIDNADEKGFIVTRCDVDCYLARKLRTI